MDFGIMSPLKKRKIIQKPMIMNKIVLKGYSLEQLEAFVKEQGEPRFRADQLFLWMYKHQAASFDEMSDISRAFRQRLNEMAELHAAEIEAVQASKSGDTQKLLFRLHDGARVEAVLMFEDDRRTLCISTQVGCPIDCKFCATGLMGLKRNLTPGEIVDQVILAQRHAGQPITNLVVMGMGEPLLNYDNLMQALDILVHDKGPNLARRHIVVSTSGVLPAMQRFLQEGRKFRLAISLNATTDEVRTRIIPINKKWPIAALLQFAREYTRRSRERLTFEYVLLHGINDTLDDARRLRRMLTGIRCKVNLIPYNPTVRGFEPPPQEAVQRFYQELLPLRAPVTIRWSKGVDIDAGCGQLVTKVEHADRLPSEEVVM